MRLLLQSLLERVGVSFKIGSSRSKEGGNILDVDGQMVRGGLENYTIFMDVICIFP